MLLCDRQRTRFIIEGIYTSLRVKLIGYSVLIGNEKRLYNLVVII